MGIAILQCLFCAVELVTKLLLLNVQSRWELSIISCRLVNSLVLREVHNSYVCGFNRNVAQLSVGLPYNQPLCRASGSMDKLAVTNLDNACFMLGI